MPSELLFFDDGEADPVVSEVPVFVNNNAGNSLVVLQYPTRKAEYHTSKVLSLNIKPEAQILETNIDPQIPPEFVSRDNGHQKLTQKYSGILNDTKSHYAVGVLENGAFHVSIVPRAGQLRPDFPAKTPLLNQAMLQAKTPRPDQTSLRSVQMSVKSTSQEVPKHSAALGYWRQANKEEPVPLELGELSESQKTELLAKAQDGEVDATMTY